MKVIGKDSTWTPASRNTEVRVPTPVISLREQVLRGVRMVHQGCVAERRDRRKVPVGDQ